MSLKIMVDILILILFSADNKVAIQHLRVLSNIQNLIKLYSNPEKSDHEKRLILMLLLTIERYSKTPDRKEEASTALLELGIMPTTFARKLQELYDELDPCINHHQSYWVYRVSMWLVYLVQNYEKGSYYCSEAMTEAMEMVQRTFFMMTFVDLFDGCHSVQYLNGLLTRFVHISTDTYNQMNPQYALLQLGEEEEEQEKYVDPLFLQEHDVSHTHILQVLRHKLAESTSDEEKKMIGEMLKRLADLNALLH
jgi:hypothetical protein